MKQDFIMDWMILVGQDDFIFGYLNNFYLKDGVKATINKDVAVSYISNHIVSPIYQ